jgi:hypothetical protein
MEKSMSMRTKIFVIVAIYCAIFAWMSVPFVTTDSNMLRKQVMFVDGLQEQIVADSGAVSGVN